MPLMLNMLPIYPEDIIEFKCLDVMQMSDNSLGQFDTILLLSIGALQGTAGININTNGNVLINTSTDAGFKLDVNGTTRLNGNITGVGTLGITIPSVNTLANGSITAVPSSWG
jgi:hypothetical protein